MLADLLLPLLLVIVFCCRASFSDTVCLGCPSGSNSTATWYYTDAAISLRPINATLIVSRGINASLLRLLRPSLFSNSTYLQQLDLWDPPLNMTGAHRTGSLSSIPRLETSASGVFGIVQTGNTTGFPASQPLYFESLPSNCSSRALIAASDSSSVPSFQWSAESTDCPLRIVSSTVIGVLKLVSLSASSAANFTLITGGPTSQQAIATSRPPRVIRFSNASAAAWTGALIQADVISVYSDTPGAKLNISVVDTLSQNQTAGANAYVLSGQTGSCGIWMSGGWSNSESSRSILPLEYFLRLDDYYNVNITFDAAQFGNGARLVVVADEGADDSRVLIKATATSQVPNSTSTVAKQLHVRWSGLGGGMADPIDPDAYFLATYCVGDKGDKPRRTGSGAGNQVAAMLLTLLLSSFVASLTV